MAGDSRVQCPASFWVELMQQAVAGGNELAACELLKQQAVEEVPPLTLLEVKSMALYRGLAVIEQGLAYALQLKQLRDARKEGSKVGIS